MHLLSQVFSLLQCSTLRVTLLTKGSIFVWMQSKLYAHWMCIAEYLNSLGLCSLCIHVHVFRSTLMLAVSMIPMADQLRLWTTLNHIVGVSSDVASYDNWPCPMITHTRHSRDNFVTLSGWGSKGLSRLSVVYMEHIEPSYDTNSFPYKWQLVEGNCIPNAYVYLL